MAGLVDQQEIALVFHLPICLLLADKNEPALLSDHTFLEINIKARFNFLEIQFPSKAGSPGHSEVLSQIHCILRLGLKRN